MRSLKFFWLGESVLTCLRPSEHHQGLLPMAQLQNGKGKLSHRSSCAHLVVLLKVPTRPKPLTKKTTTAPMLSVMQPQRCSPWRPSKTRLLQQAVIDIPIAIPMRSSWRCKSIRTTCTIRTHNVPSIVDVRFASLFGILIPNLRIIAKRRCHSVC